MVLGKPSQVRALITPAFTGVDGQTSVLLGFPTGTQAVLTCNFSADTPTRAAIVGTEAASRSTSPFYAPPSLPPSHRDGTASRFAPALKGVGLHYEAAEVERCWAGLPESPVMPLDETIWIMETMDAVLSQAAAGHT